MSQLLKLTCALIMSLTCVGCATAPPTEPAPTMRQAAKAQKIRCTADQRRGCWVEFKCVEGDAKERAGCRATRSECLASCVR